MRLAPQQIWDAWQSGGPFIGEWKPNGVVTVELGWNLRTTAGNEKITSIRYWNRKAAGSITEVPIPGVKNIDITRSLDADAGTLSLQIYNQRLDANGAVSESESVLGQPGYLNFNHGETEAQSRWGQVANTWADVLVPNSLLRVYQGYGGHSKTLNQAINEGNLVLSGVFLVDETRTSGGMLTLSCRDMGKLLIEQQLIEPFVPGEDYPLHFYRWDTDNSTYDNSPTTVTREVTTTSGSTSQINFTYETSSVDAWYGSNATIYGHKGTDSVDGSDITFALGEGNYYPDRIYATSYWQYVPQSPNISRVFLHPWAGNYTLYISVMEDGNWVSNGEGNIPYDHTPLIGHQPTVVDTGADIPYVMKTSVPWETSKWYDLPRAFNAQKIRLSFRNLADSGLGTNRYRAGIRRVWGEGVTGTSSSTTTSSGFLRQKWFGLDTHPGTGYVANEKTGRVYATGDATVGTSPAAGNYRSIAMNNAGDGYYLLEASGRVVAVGAATHYGNGTGQKARDIAVTPSGLGYFIIFENGTVQAFGSAVHQGNVSSPTRVTSITARSNTSYWALDGAGTVYEFGGAPVLGDFAFTLVNHEFCTRIRTNSTFDGYWILSGMGLVSEHGTAGDFQGVKKETTTTPADDSWEGWPEMCIGFAVSNTDLGYGILRSNGTITARGDFPTFGSPKSGLIYEPGNYNDYAQIVLHLLLYAGWHLPGAAPALDYPAVFGAVEATGAYADEPLPVDMFDRVTVAEGINALRQIVGYIFMVGPEGEAVFRMPNTWWPGNFEDATGLYTALIPEIDEEINLISFGAVVADRYIPSRITISTDHPDTSQESTVTTTFTPIQSSGLRNIERPMWWSNEAFKNPREQITMAALMSMRLFFRQRQGSVRCPANPCLGLDDQIRVYDRIAGEHYIHYIQGMNTSMDLDTGVYTMDLTTHWMGTDENWVVDAFTGTVTQTVGGEVSLELSGSAYDYVFEYLERSNASRYQSRTAVYSGETSKVTETAEDLGSEGAG